MLVFLFLWESISTLSTAFLAPCRSKFYIGVAHVFSAGAQPKGSILAHILHRQIAAKSRFERSRFSSSPMIRACVFFNDVRAFRTFPRLPLPRRILEYRDRSEKFQRYRCWISRRFRKVGPLNRIHATQLCISALLYTRPLNALRTVPLSARVNN